jgi:hypothetical protein
MESEKLAELQDLLDALCEAQPKTVKERMKKYIEQRPTSKVEELHKEFATNQSIGLYTLVTILTIWASVIVYINL